MTSATRKLLAYEAARMALARLKVPGGAELKNAFAITSEIAASTLRVARVGCWLYLPDRAALRCFHLHDLGGKRIYEGAIIEKDECPAYFEAISRQSILPIEDAWNDPASRELRRAYLQPLDIQAMLDVPVFLDGTLRGVVCHEHVGGTRVWSPEDQAFAKSVAETIARQALEAQKVTLQKRIKVIREEMKARDQSEALGRFSAAIGHDLRNFLQTILAPSSMIASNPDVDAGTRELAGIIETSATRATELVADLLAFGRRDPRQPCVMDLHTAAAACCRAQAIALPQGIRIHFAGEPGVCRALIDPVQFDRILTNLIVNARDAMPAGGEISVTVRPTTDSDNAHCVISNIMVEVRDTGIGMDAKTKARLFEPFFTTKPLGKGTGLGLSIVSQIVERSGGFVHVDSMPGRGTTFRIFLPMIGSRTPPPA